MTKFSPDGTTLLYATYLGGSDHELGQVSFTPPMKGGGIAVNSQNEAYVTGTTASPDFPVHNALQNAKAGRLDAFVAKLAADGSSLLFSTYLGGATHLEFDVIPQPAANRGNAIAIDSAGNAYVTGVTDALDFPTVNAFQSSYAGGIIVPDLEGDAFVTKMASDGSSLVYSTIWVARVPTRIHFSDMTKGWPLLWINQGVRMSRELRPPRIFPPSTLSNP